mgnify:CR=1 FL=1
MKHITVTITARKNYYPDFHNYVNNFTYKIDTHDHVFILESNKHSMAQIRDIMEKNVITIEYNKTTLDAARLISEKDVSFLVIMKDDTPVGVLSESDFVKRLAANDKRSSDVIISEIMSSNFRWVEPETELEDAIQKMLNNNIRRLVILDDNKLVGIITQTDFTGFLRDKLLVDKTIKNIQKN